MLQSMGLKRVGQNWATEQEQQALESRCGYQDLPGDPAVLSAVPCRGHGFHPWLGNLKVPYDVPCGQIKGKKYIDFYLKFKSWRVITSPSLMEVGRKLISMWYHHELHK